MCLVVSVGGDERYVICVVGLNVVFYGGGLFIQGLVYEVLCGCVIWFCVG